MVAGSSRIRAARDGSRVLANSAAASHLLFAFFAGAVMASPIAEYFQELLAAIERHWGFREFRPIQEAAMRAVVERRDSLVIMPTGGGKSLCFQAPALVRPKETTVVVSPLIALMKDQVDSLRAVGVSARHVHSGLTDSEKRTTFEELRLGQIRLLFVSPERLMQDAFQNFLHQLGVRTFAIDEAHCISHWGHDFRPEYRQISMVRARFREAAFHAYTATATERVRDDILQQLGLRNPEVLVGNFDRPNLTYRVVPRQNLVDQVMDVIGRHPNEAGIIYCIRRKDVDELATTLKEKGIKAMPYHAGLDHEARKSAQDAFRAERCNIVVATVAFGMGIDRSNVRFVLHTGIPKSIEHYQQESGRAGRDGLEAECILLHSGRDFVLWRFIIQKSAEENPVEAEFVPMILTQLEEMNSYCKGASCRHRMLVEHFGQTYAGENCQACDLCLGEVGFETESQTIARKVISCVARVGQRFGVNHVVGVLRRDNTERIRKWSHDKLSTYGLLDSFSEAQVRDWTYQLINQGLLDQTEDQYPILQLNGDSWQVLRNERQVRLQRFVERKASRTSRGAEISWEGVDLPLFERLREWRKARASEYDLAPYMVLSDVSLRELARRRPSSLEQLRLVYGIGDTKLREFGEVLVNTIVAYCRETGLATDTAAPVTFTAPKAEKVTLGAEAAFPHFRRGASIAEVAQATGRAPSTIVGYLCAFIQEHRPDTISAWVDDATRFKVIEAAKRAGTAFLKPIFIALDEKVPYEQIRIVLAHAAAKDLSVDRKDSLPESS
jgi:ATP-dependent DNA helicase RecQ